MLKNDVGICLLQKELKDIYGNCLYFFYPNSYISLNNVKIKCLISNDNLNSIGKAYLNQKYDRTLKMSTQYFTDYIKSDIFL